jgi:hypothetical protein
MTENQCRSVIYDPRHPVQAVIIRGPVYFPVLSSKNVITQCRHATSTTQVLHKVDVVHVCDWTIAPRGQKTHCLLHQAWRSRRTKRDYLPLSLTRACGCSAIVARWGCLGNEHNASRFIRAPFTLFEHFGRTPARFFKGRPKPEKQHLAAVASRFFASFQPRFIGSSSSTCRINRSGSWRN